MTKFNNGDGVRDLITGIEGIIIATYFHLSGCQYLMVEPPPVDGKRSEELYLPEERFTFVLAGDPDMISVPDISNCHVKLGDEVKDSLTGLTGHAIIIQIPLHGVGRIAIEPTTIIDGKMADAVFFDEQRVEVIKAKPAPVAKAMPAERKTRGAAPSAVSAKVMRRGL
jgi:hypothetical protein